MLKRPSFFFLLLVMGLCACDPDKIDGTGMMTAEVNAVSWSTSQLEEASFNPTIGKLSLKGTANGQKIHLYAENFVNEGSEATFSFSQAQMMPLVYCPTFDSVGNPLPNVCGWEHGFSLEKQAIKWLIQSNCEKEVATFTWEMTKDGQTAAKTEKVNAAGNSQTPQTYWFFDTDAPQQEIIFYAPSKRLLRAHLLFLVGQTLFEMPFLSMKKARRIIAQAVSNSQNMIQKAKLFRERFL